jgi:hypothetical protein
VVEFGLDVKKDIAVDKTKLDEMSEVQSSKYYFYACELTEVKNELEIKENNLKAKLATRELFYRRNPPIDLKITEGVITALVNADTEVLDARDEVRVAKEKVSAMYDIVNALDVAQKSTDNLVKLHINKYYNTTENTSGMRDRLN